MPTGAEHSHSEDEGDALVRGASASASGHDVRNALVRLLALLGSASPLNVLLEGLATQVETWSTGLHCTLLLVDATGQTLQPGAAPSLPRSYIEAIGSIPMAVGQGSCGTAAARREIGCVEDIE